MPGCGAVHLFLQHPFVDRAHGVLRAAEDLGAGARRMAKGELGDRPADPTLDALGAEGKLGLAFPLAPFLGPVGVADRHANHRDGRVNAADRQYARDAPAGADDDVAADLLAQDPVRAPHVVCALRRDRRGLEPETGFDDGSGGLVDDSVTGCPARLEREVEAIELQRHADDVRGKDTQRFLEEFLTRLVALEDDDGPAGHDRQSRGFLRRANRDDASSSNRERREYRIPVGRFLSQVEMTMRTLADIKRELDQATEHRTALWQELGGGADPQRSAEIARLNALIESLWQEARIARNRVRFGEPTDIVRRARADERLVRDLAKVA